jgi:M6 family metalloprotease-like protein
MKLKVFMMGIWVIAILGMGSNLFAVSATPNPIAAEQPDGTELTVRLFGDEYYSYFESDDGYAITKDAAGWWKYAELDHRGRYTPSQFQAGRKDIGAIQFLNSVGKHLREDAGYTQGLRDIIPHETIENIYKKMVEQRGGKAPIHINIPILLINFSNTATSETSQSFRDMMNQANYNGTGSFFDYYDEISYGNLLVTATVYEWVVSANTHNYHAYNLGSPTRWQRARGLALEALALVDARDSPTWSVFDNDNDGDVDVLFVVHEGAGAEAGDHTNIWSHAWSLGTPPPTYGGRTFRSYIMMPEVNSSGNHIEIGVFCHEFGHRPLGLPDLYDLATSNPGSGIGEWGLMGSGSWGGNGSTPELPTHMCAYSKIECSWINPTVITMNTTATPINQVETNPEAYVLWTNTLPLTEYFIVENRQQTGFDINIHNPGLAIWHVDRSAAPQNNKNHYLVDLEQADGLRHLNLGTNRGDGGDLYPGSSNNLNFNGGTTPNSDDYSNAATQICVDNISSPGPVMFADLCVPTPGVPNLMIRDCAADVGNEPDNQCTGNFVRSLDIWVDNNDDGIIDAPIIGVQNHFYVRAWNIGAPTFDATIECYYKNPALGLTFPSVGCFPIFDEKTGMPFVTIPTPTTLNPTPSGQGFREYFLWTIPNPPPGIDHYCIGCIIQNAADPQISNVPLQENNLGQINYWALALKAGTTPRGFVKASPTTTMFREVVQVNNPFDIAGDFQVIVDVEGYSVAPSPVIELFLEAGANENITIDIYNDDAEHMDSTPVAIQLYRISRDKLVPNELVGGIFHDLYIDDYAPEIVPGFEVNHYDPPVDNLPDEPWPKYVLTWFAPSDDVGGDPERVRKYEIHAATDSVLLLNPNMGTLVEPTGLDADPTEPGYQYNFYKDNDSVYYFTIVSIDLAGNASDPAPPKTACTTGDVCDRVLAGENVTFGWYCDGQLMTDQEWSFDFAAFGDLNLTHATHTGMLNFRETYPEYEGQALYFIFHPLPAANGWRQTIVHANGVSDVYAYNAPYVQLEADWVLPDLIPSAGGNFDTIFTAVDLGLYCQNNPDGFVDGEWENGQTLNDLEVVLVEGQAEGCEGIYWAESEFEVDLTGKSIPVPTGGMKDLINSIEYPTDLFIVAAHSSSLLYQLPGPSCCHLPGDANGDQDVNIGDVVFTINYVFGGGAPPSCFDEGDANLDCDYNVGDAVFMISYIFNGGPPPVCGCVE